MMRGGRINRSGTGAYSGEDKDLSHLHAYSHELTGTNMTHTTQPTHMIHSA